MEEEEIITVTVHFFTHNNCHRAPTAVRSKYLGLKAITNARVKRGYSLSRVIGYLIRADFLDEREEVSLRIENVSVSENLQLYEDTHIEITFSKDPRREFKLLRYA